MGLHDVKNNAQYYSIMAGKLKAEGEAFKEQHNHYPTIGHLTEQAFIDFLKSKLPGKFEVCSGTISYPDGSKSPQQDVIIYDSLNYGPDFQQGDVVIVPLKSVRVVIEVKSNLKTDVGKQAINKLVDLKQKAKKYLGADFGKGLFITGILAFDIDCPHNLFQMIRFANAPESADCSPHFVSTLGKGGALFHEDLNSYDIHWPRVTYDPSLVLLMLVVSSITKVGMSNEGLGTYINNGIDDIINLDRRRIAISMLRPKLGQERSKLEKSLYKIIKSPAPDDKLEEYLIIWSEGTHTVPIAKAIGCCYFDRGQINEAIHWLSMAVNNGDVNRVSWENLYCCALVAKDFPGAKRVATRMLEIEGHDHIDTELTYLCYAHMCLEEYEDAENILQKTANSNHAAYPFARALYLFKTGPVEETRQFWRSVKKTDLDIVEKARMSVLLGNIAQAKKALYEYIKVDRKLGFLITLASLWEFESVREEKWFAEWIAAYATKYRVSTY